ncbi:MAG TPA: GDCCVxC domain-containing (seleno)protein [Gemmatimonadaceae bacterium]
MELHSRLTCPHCRHSEQLAMPTNACVVVHECPNCHRLLRPNAGDCCVFCSFGSVPCPPMQTGDACRRPDVATALTRASSARA